MSLYLIRGRNRVVNLGLGRNVECTVQHNVIMPFLAYLSCSFITVLVIPCYSIAIIKNNRLTVLALHTNRGKFLSLPVSLSVPCVLCIVRGKEKGSRPLRQSNNESK